MKVLFFNMKAGARTTPVGMLEGTTMSELWENAKALWKLTPENACFVPAEMFLYTDIPDDELVKWDKSCVDVTTLRLKKEKEERLKKNGQVK